MPSFEIPTDIIAHLSVFDSPKGSSDTFKTREKYRPGLQKKALSNVLLFLSKHMLHVEANKAGS